MAVAVGVTSASDADRGSLRLSAFLTEWRRLQPPPASPVTLRLQTFVEAWRALPRACSAVSASAEARHELSAERLGQVLSELKPALDHANASGAFVNVWRVAGLGRKERRAADALAWLLEPRGDHGLRTAPIDALFDALQEASPGCPRPTDPMRCSIRVEDRPMYSDRDRVDLVVDHPELLLFVEIKVDATEGVEQLRRYAEAAEDMARCAGRPAWRVAYLTRSTTRALEGGIIPLIWRDLSRAMRSRLAGTTPASHARTMIKQLLDHFARF